ncbi:MAG: D-2-hydroxyacid dehydrogenase family protein [Deltaproteobacteria bacterium]|nr:D-2-hydroxyacid dehydrogenase family protein [Deltaproteobacteria bacterium]
MKIVVCDDVDGAFRGSGELARLEAVGTVTVYNRVAETRGALLDRLRAAAVAVAVRDRTVLDREMLTALPELRLIASTGPHRIDLKAATELGVVVTTTPGTSTASVGEHVFGLILALARQITRTDQALRLHRWEPAAGLELEGKTLGILGLGRTGGAVARRAPAFGLQVIAWGPTLTPERAAASGARMVSEEELFRTADILSVHLRRSELSRNFVNAARLALMKPAALLIDISWAGIVDRQALAAALRAGRLAGAALDLCDTGPVDMQDPILDAPRTVLTPHLAWQTVESYQRSARVAVDSILAYLKGSPVNVVNAEALKGPRQAG